MDEITTWWQKALGKQAVLGQASNRPPSGQRAPVPILLWTKPESDHAEPERKVVEATPGATEKHGTDNRGTPERKGYRSPTALGQLKHWSGVMVSSVVLFLAILLLRIVGAVFVATRVALGILTVEFRRVRRWSHLRSRSWIPIDSRAFWARRY